MAIENADGIFSRMYPRLHTFESENLLDSLHMEGNFTNNGSEDSATNKTRSHNKKASKTVRRRCKGRVAKDAKEWIAQHNTIHWAPHDMPATLEKLRLPAIPTKLVVVWAFQEHPYRSRIHCQAVLSFPCRVPYETTAPPNFIHEH